MNPRRALEYVLVPLALLGTMVVPLLVWQDRLPDEIAVHFGPSGEPDRGQSPWSTTALLAVTFVVLWVSFTLPVARGRVGGIHARILIGGSWFLGGMLATIGYQMVQKSLDVSRWQDAGNLGGADLAIMLAIGLALGALGYLVAGDHPEVDGVTTEVDPVASTPTDTKVWSGGATNPVFVVVALVVATAPIIPALLIGERVYLGIIGASAILVGLLASTLSRVRVTIGPKGLVVRYGWLNWPRTHIPSRDIAAVSVEEVQPMRYGGWGYRVVPGARAVVLRNGPAIRVERRDGPAFVVTVEDAAHGAAVLAGHVGSPSHR